MVIKDSFKSFFPITSILSFRSFSVMRAPKVKSKTYQFLLDYVKYAFKL